MMMTLFDGARQSFGLFKAAIRQSVIQQWSHSCCHFQIAMPL